MTRLPCRAALILTLSVTLAAAEVSISFLDGKSTSYLKHGSRLDGEVGDLAAVVTSLLNVPPVRGVGASTSDQVASIIRADPFSRPQAVLLLSVAGGSADLLPEAAAAQTRAAGSDSDVVSALVALAAARGVEHSLLDVGSLRGCGESCLESMLQDSLAVLQLEANYTAGEAPLRGQLVLRQNAEAAAVALDLRRVPDRLLAVELVSTLRTAQNLADDNAQRKAAGVYQPRPQLVRRTLVSLQAVRDAYGQDSAELAAANRLVQALLGAVSAQLRASFSDRLVVVLAAFQSLHAGSETVSLLGGTASIHASAPGRSLLATSQGSSNGAYEEQFIAWVTMWGVAFLLLFFALAGCHCLRTMRFKQDSLLYGKNKVE